MSRAAGAGHAPRRGQAGGPGQLRGQGTIRFSSSQLYTFKTGLKDKFVANADFPIISSKQLLGISYQVSDLPFL